MKKDIIKLRYGNTNTFFLPGKGGGLLVDTDYAGMLPQFFHAIKTAGVEVRDISYVIATHFHPDHIGLVGELQKLCVTLVILEEQLGSVHFADRIFARDRRIHYTPIDETSARVITCAESRSFLHDLGIEGEILHTPSHSEDSVSVLLDDGVCMVGDLEPMEFLEGYADNPQLQRDWEQIMTHRPNRILFAHANEKTFKKQLADASKAES